AGGWSPGLQPPELAGEIQQHVAHLDRRATIADLDTVSGSSLPRPWSFGNRHTSERAEGPTWGTDIRLRGDVSAQVPSADLRVLAPPAGFEPATHGLGTGTTHGF